MHPNTIDIGKMQDYEYTEGYFSLIAEQRSDAWFSARKFRCTASLASVFVSGESKFTTLEKVINVLVGRELQDPVNVAMQLGSNSEEIAQKNYEEISENKVKEVSLCIPIWNANSLCNYQNLAVAEVNFDHGTQLENPLHPHWFIAGSPDGLVLDPSGDKVNLEIKFPKALYHSLKNNFIERQRVTPGVLGNKYGVDSHSHIFISHYMQMQQCMAVTGASFCDYFVDNPIHDKNNPPYLERIPFDPVYWWDYMYPNLIEVIETKIKPLIKKREMSRFKTEVEKLISLTK